MLPLLLLGGLCSTLRYRDVLPGFTLGRTTRECHVHGCEQVEEVQPSGRAGECPRQQGHMQPMGQQQPIDEVPRVAVTDSATFYERYVAGAQPVVLSGAATAATHGVEWDDALLLRACHLRGGAPWQSIIEVNKVIVSNTRYPLLSSDARWNFCEFVKNYTKPEHRDSMYVVSPLSDPGVQLGKFVELPSVLRCSEMHESVHDTRLWMSSGGTSSSLHFDTHENLMLQVDGTKDVYFWPPSASHLTYMDYHNRYGLSPVNPDRVDLERYPLFAALRGGMHATLTRGDALFIPDGWWHQVRTRPGRNIAVTWEFEPYEGVEALWPDRRDFARFLRDPKWSRQVQRKYSNKKLVTTRHGAIRCNESVHAVTADSFKCSENHGHDASGCNFRCLPHTCVTEQVSLHALRPPLARLRRCLNLKASACSDCLNLSVSFAFSFL
jgi:hypothetical protein